MADIQDKSNWIVERNELQSSYSDMKSLNHNLTQSISKLENEKDHLIKERDELQNHIGKWKFNIHFQYQKL